LRCNRSNTATTNNDDSRHNSSSYDGTNVMIWSVCNQYKHLKNERWLS